MKLRFMFSLIFLCTQIFGQTVVTTTPQFPTQKDSIVLEFDVTNATHQNKIAGYTGQVYAHTGVTISTNNGTPARWQNVIGTWGSSSQPKLTRISTNIYSITISNPRSFYNVTDASKKITELCFVLRSSDNSKQTEDIFITLYESGIAVVINSPQVNTSFGDPARSPIFIDENATLSISFSTSELGTKTKSIELFVNDEKKYESSTNTLDYNFVASENPKWMNTIRIIASDTASLKDTAIFVIVKNTPPVDEPLPEGNKIGINYDSNGNIILALYAPYKKNVFLLCNQNNWRVDSSYALKRYQITADSVIWWIQVPQLLADPLPPELRYQFLIDGSIRIPDPYTETILDPWNDSDAELQKVYPDLQLYPSGETENIVSVLPHYKEQFNWQIPNFVRPQKEKLIVYELLIRDFVSTHSYQTLKDTLSYFRKLGVNAIELMPINEFEGNRSWGYNPMMYFAPDKYYGSATQLKEFVDACHQSGIAVIMDIVLNHSYGLSPMVQMYWDSTNARPAANNPWYNQQSNFQNPDAQWGYDFNHESKATQYFVDRVLEYWLTEFKMDSFRFDFTKGFSNNIKSSSGDSWGSLYDADRIRILKRMVDKVWSYDSTAILIFEHLAENSEEKELADHGILLWGNFNYNYNEATMGWVSNSNFSNISYKNKNWNGPNLVGYMESHDEERLMYKNIQYGNSSGSYNIKDLSTALDRIILAATFFVTVPGPKMIWQFGELGYDKSINYPSGTSSDRLTPKPILWDYYSDENRKELFNVFSGLIKLKKNYPVFSTTDFSLNVSGAGKSIQLNDNSMKANILGNFDVSNISITSNFQNTGMWYEFFSGDSLNVTDIEMQITLQPGEYKLYTSVKLPSLDFIVGIKDAKEIPTEFKLEQNYPNPFNPETIISYQLPVAEFVSLKVYDVLGREIATLVNEYQQSGDHYSTFSTLHYSLSSGIYFYRLKAGNFFETKKMLLLK
jgi:1,4-alpha-glucan branching enzyme